MKEDRQIVWMGNKGFYHGEELFSIWFAPSEQRIILDYLDVYSKPYTTVKSAKRGAERFLKTLQKQLNEKKYEGR